MNAHFLLRSNLAFIALTIPILVLECATARVDLMPVKSSRPFQGKLPGSVWKVTDTTVYEAYNHKPRETRRFHKMYVFGENDLGLYWDIEMNNEIPFIYKVEDGRLLIRGLYSDMHGQTEWDYSYILTVGVMRWEKKDVASHRVIWGEVQYMTDKTNFWHDVYNWEINKGRRPAIAESMRKYGVEPPVN